MTRRPLPRRIAPRPPARPRGPVKTHRPSVLGAGLALLAAWPVAAASPETLDCIADTGGAFGITWTRDSDWGEGSLVFPGGILDMMLTAEQTEDPVTLRAFRGAWMVGGDFTLLTRHEADQPTLAQLTLPGLTPGDPAYVMTAVCTVAEG